VESDAGDACAGIMASANKTVAAHKLIMGLRFTFIGCLLVILTGLPAALPVYEPGVAQSMGKSLLLG
jgi:hypothetical protein